MDETNADKWTRRAEKWDQAGKKLDNAGKAVNGFVGSLVLIGLILFVMVVLLKLA